MVTTNDGGKTATCDVSITLPIPEAVDLGLSVKWASFNLGASEPEDYGDYYAWGETEPKTEYSWATYKWRTSFNDLTKYNTESIHGRVDNKTVLDWEDDAAYVFLGSHWRLPTRNELQELISNCDCMWYNNYNGTGVNGYVITARNGNSIFLPAAGRINGGSFEGANTDGHYWTSSLDLGLTTRAWKLRFFKSYFKEDYAGRILGYPIRPVFDN